MASSSEGAVEWVPTGRGATVPARAGAAISFSSASTAYLRSSLVANDGGMAEAMQQTSAAAGRAEPASEAIDDMLTRGTRTSSLNAGLVNLQMRERALSEAALAVDILREPSEMRSLAASTWAAFEFAEAGSLGIRFTAVDEASPLLVDGVEPAGLAAGTDVAAGMLLEAVQPPDQAEPLHVVGRLGFSQVIALLQRSGRPLRLWFSVAAKRPNPHGKPLPVAMPVGATERQVAMIRPEPRQLGHSNRTSGSRTRACTRPSTHALWNMWRHTSRTTNSVSKKSSVQMEQFERSPSKCTGNSRSGSAAPGTGDCRACSASCAICLVVTIEARR